MDDQLENEQFVQVIRKNLHVESVLLTGVEDEFVFDLENVVGLLNNIHNSPSDTLSLILKYQIAINGMIANVREDREAIRIARDQFFAKKYKKYSQQDEDVNPYYKKAKLTVNFVESLINDDEHYNQLQLEYNRLDGLTNRLYAVKNSVDALVDLAKLLVENPERIPASGVVVEKSDIEEQLARLKSRMLHD